MHRKQIYQKKMDRKKTYSTLHKDVQKENVIQDNVHQENLHKENVRIEQKCHRQYKQECNNVQVPKTSIILQQK